MTTNRQNSRRNSFSYDFRARKKPISKVIKGLPVDYKDVDVLISYVSDRAKISSAYRVGNDAKDHRSLTTAIKRARYMALLPISHDHELVRNFIEESTEETKAEDLEVKDRYVTQLGNNRYYVFELIKKRLNFLSLQSMEWPATFFLAKKRK